MGKQSSIALGAGIFLADQITKYYAEQNWQVVKNPAFLFGIDLPPAASVATSGILFSVFWIMYRYYFGEITFGFALIISGALGNIVDRIMLGYVRDFLDIGIATVNLGDIAVWVGIVLLLLDNVKFRNHSTLSS